MNDIAEAGTPAAPLAGTPDLAAELMAAISSIRRIARRAVRQAFAGEPLPPAQSELLRLAAARPGLSVADAAHELRLAPNTVSTLVGRLTAAGLLERTPGGLRRAFGAPQRDRGGQAADRELA